MNSTYPLYEVRKLTSVKDMLSQSVALYGEKNAFLVKKEKNGPFHGITYRAFGEDVSALGTALLKLGLSGKKIAIIGENRYEWAVSYLAALNGESMVVPLDKELPFEDLTNLMKTAGVSCVIYSGKFSEGMRTLKETVEPLEVLINMDASADGKEEKAYNSVLHWGKRLLQEGDNAFASVSIDPEAARILLFTSGTTALPKGVLLSHKNLAVDLMAMCQMLYIDEKDVFLSVLPLHHTYECTCGFLCALYRGCTVAYGQGLKYILSNLKEAKATMMLGVPALFETMYKRIWNTAKKNGLEKKMKTGMKLSAILLKFHIDLRKKLFAQIHETLGGYVRLFISGAAAIDPVVSKGFQAFGIEFIQGYGITECSPIVALNRDYAFKDDAAGLPMPCLEVTVFDKDTDGIGEIVCKGDSVMLGYYQNEEATREAFAGGWFHTGDLGYQDSDGFIHITGRKKNVIVTKNGKNIFPEELETLLNRNPVVLESMVSGEYCEEDGETYPCAQILPNYEYIRETYGDITPEKVQELAEEAVREINERNPLYKYIRGVKIRDTEFVKTTTQKIKRYVEEKKA